jgi:ElaA protein
MCDFELDQRAGDHADHVPARRERGIREHAHQAAVRTAVDQTETAPCDLAAELADRIRVAGQTIRGRQVHAYAAHAATLQRVQLAWHDRTFGELSAAELYAIVHLRERVFVVEQKCVYLDADGIDLTSRHVFATNEDAASSTRGTVVAYLRVVPPGSKFAERSIGRVVVAPGARSSGLGRELMRRALVAYGDQPIRIAAQTHLQTFYATLGFRRVSDVFDDDGIPHVEMLRPVD